MAFRGESDQKKQADGRGIKLSHAMKPTPPAEPDRYAQSQSAFAQAQQVMPGGVSSPVRAYRAVGGHPVFAARGQGGCVTDLDGHVYVDYVMSYGPLILGHCPPSVVQAVKQAVDRGFSFGMPTPGETDLAQAIVQAMANLQSVRFVSSGTEAVMSAIRLARAATARQRIIKCIGGYHGHSDSLLVQAGSGAATLAIPTSPGVPPQLTALTHLVPYNDALAVQAIMDQFPKQIAAVLIEPVAGNMGCVPPLEGYLASLDRLCREHGALLIFDEVMTGFRVAHGGAQSLYQIKPDITCLGKVVGGGLPCAAYGGSKAIMDWVAPQGPMYQAGTLSGNPLAMAAGLATLQSLAAPGVYDHLDKTAGHLADGLSSLAAKHGVPLRVQRVGSMLTPFFTDRPVRNYDDATACDTRAFGHFFRAMLDRGVMLPPSQFEAWFVSTAHTPELIDRTLRAADESLAKLTPGGAKNRRGLR